MRFGRSYFNEATGRLARLLNIDGEIPVDLGKEITPTVLIGDATAPGNCLVRGRRWVARFAGNGAASGYATFRATRSVVLDGMFPWNTTGTGGLYILSPTDIAASGLTFANVGIFTERMVSSSDVPPFEQATTFTDPGAGKVLLTPVDMVLATAANLNLSVNWPVPIFLQEGAGISIFFSAASGKGWIKGYEF